MMHTIRANTIHTNVVLAEDGTVWWEGHDAEPPEKGWDWQGRPWKQGVKDEEGRPIPGAHPNSRFTAPLTQCPSHSFRTEHHHGVLISAIVFGGRRAHLAPLVYESFDWEHGVFVGATMASERTAAQFGKLGENRRDPMAMLPFCGYHMGDYFAHWLKLGAAHGGDTSEGGTMPKIFYVNWFRKSPEGKWLWPGFGENSRVLKWIFQRCADDAEAVDTPIGRVPADGALDLDGLDVPADDMAELLRVDPDEWKEVAGMIAEHFQKFGDRLPQALADELKSLNERLNT
jgi:phosphoenolpyruvate carboxykinase (GTP)